MCCDRELQKQVHTLGIQWEQSVSLKEIGMITNDHKKKHVFRTSGNHITLIDLIDGDINSGTIHRYPRRIMALMVKMR